MGQEHSRSQAGNNQPQFIDEIPAQRGEAEGKCCSHCAALIADRGWGVVEQPLPLPRWAQGRAETSELCPQNLSQPSAGAGGLSSLPARPQDSLAMLQERSQVGLCQGDPLASPAHKQTRHNRQLWVGKTSLALEGSTGKTRKPCATNPQSGGRAVPTSAQIPGYLRLLGGDRG